MLAGLVLLSLPVSSPTHAQSVIDATQAALPPSLKIDQAELQRLPGQPGYRLSGDVTLNLSPALAEAIRRGVTLRFSSDFQLIEPRWWWQDRVVHRLTREASLSLHPITGRFRVSVDEGPPQAFNDLTQALKACLALRGWVVLPAPSPALAGREAWVQLRLEPSALPKALLVTALTSSNWSLDTGRVRVRLPDATGEISP